MTTLGEYRATLAYLVDEDVTVERAAEALNAALRAVLPFVPMRQVHEYTGDSTIASFDLPSDFYAADAVFDANGDSVPHLRPVESEHIGSEYGNAWMLYPHGKLTFLAPPEGTFKLYYQALWPEVTADDTATVLTPSMLLNALLYYGAAFYLIPGSVSSAEIRQYLSRVDAGNPEHNPVGKQVQYMLSLFETEIRRYANSSLRFT